VSPTRVQVVERAIDILAALSNGPATLSEVTRAVDLPKGTIFRILASLQYGDMVVKDPVDNTYQIGPGFLRLSRSQSPWFGPLATLARPMMAELLEFSRETVAIHVRVGPERVCIAELTSPETIRYSAEVGALVPLYVGAAGKVLLAELDEAALQKVLAVLELRPLTDGTIVDRDKLLTDVAAAREQGYAQSVGERVSSAAAITVPIDLTNGFGASLSLLGPADRLNEKVRLKLLEPLKKTAAGISAVSSTAT
jgi:DNA-binding IclR family transcriptional regulator